MLEACFGKQNFNLKVCSHLSAGLRSRYQEALAEGERLEAICKSRKNKDYIALDNPSVHVSFNQV